MCRGVSGAEAICYTSTSTTAAVQQSEDMLAVFGCSAVIEATTASKCAALCRIYLPKIERTSISQEGSHSYSPCTVCWALKNLRIECDFPPLPQRCEQFKITSGRRRCRRSFLVYSCETIALSAADTFLCGSRPPSITFQRLSFAGVRPRRAGNE